MNWKWSLLIALLPLSSAAQRGLTCISGDCRNGEGEAFLEKSVYYRGFFKKSRPEGEGYYVNRDWARTGSYKAGLQAGYGVEFPSLQDMDGLYYPDSNRGVLIGSWSEGKLTGGIRIGPDGSETYFNGRGFVSGKRPADAWMNRQADAYQDVLRRKGIVRPRQ